MDPDRNDYDVFYGRGNRIMNFNGNKRFRKIIQVYSPMYKESKMNKKVKEKDYIATEIIRAVQSRGGRFFHIKDGDWALMSKKLVVKKVKQSLRDYEYKKDETKDEEDRDERNVTLDHVEAHRDDIMIDDDDDDDDDDSQDSNSVNGLQQNNQVGRVVNLQQGGSEIAQLSDSIQFPGGILRNGLQDKQKPPDGQQQRDSQEKICLKKDSIQLELSDLLRLNGAALPDGMEVSLNLGQSLAAHDRSQKPKKYKLVLEAKLVPCTDEE